MALTKLTGVRPSTAGRIAPALTLAEAKANKGAELGQQITVIDRGNSTFEYVAAVTNNELDTAECTGVATLSLQHVDKRGDTSITYGDLGTNSASDKIALAQWVALSIDYRDARSKTSIATGVASNADTDMMEYVWPLNCTILSEGGTGEQQMLINYISNAYQVLPIQSTPWAGSTVYSLGSQRINGGQVYKVITSGTSAASGGPTGTGVDIIDGTVHWKSVDNGLFAGVPVNELRISAPYHPAIVLDQKSPVTYGGNQEAHDFMDAYDAAGGTTTGNYKTLLWSQDGLGEWQLVGDSDSETLSLHQTDKANLWRIMFNKANGDTHIQHHDTFGIGDSKPLDVAGGIRIGTDTYIDGTIRGDNKARFGKPELTLRNRDNLGGDNTHTISLAGTNGYQLLFDACDETGLNGHAESNMRFNVYKSDGAQSGFSMSGFYKSLAPVGPVSLGRAGVLWTEIFASTGTINTSDARLKTDVAEFTLDEINASKALAKEIGTYQFLASVKEKGDNARSHIGMTVQRAIQIMEENNLDAFKYGFICYNEWEDEFMEHAAVYDYVHTNVEGTEGTIDVPEQEETATLIKEAWTEKTLEAGNAYAFRYDELNQFIIKGFSARLDALEAGM